MTGYGRGQQTIENMNITVEVKSVNHRYFEFSARTPRQYMFLEEKLKSFFGQNISRGKVECFVTIQVLEAEDYTVSVNHAIAKGYLDAFGQLRDTYGLTDDVSVISLAKFNDVLIVEKNEEDQDKIWNAVLPVAQEAVKSIVEMRLKEGEKLKDDILSRIDIIAEDVKYIEKRSPETVKEYTQKLLARMNEVLESVNVDEQRILTEAAIYADKIAVAEETVRLMSHMGQLKDLFLSNEPVGRKMDFIVQEMNREANTIGSKAQDVDIAKKVVNIKSEIEKIREQIQNIE